MPDITKTNSSSCQLPHQPGSFAYGLPHHYPANQFNSQHQLNVTKREEIKQLRAQIVAQRTKMADLAIQHSLDMRNALQAIQRLVALIDKDSSQESEDVQIPVKNETGRTDLEVQQVLEKGKELSTFKEKIRSLLQELEESSI